MSAGGSTKVILYALCANLGIAIAKFIGASITKSSSMLAEAIHSLVDCTNQVFLIIGSNKSKKPASETHPLGYGREAFFWSFMVAILLFSMGGMFSIYEGFHKIHETGELKSPFIAIGILGVSILLELGSFLACLKEVKIQNPYGSLWIWFRKTTSSELLVIFTEDLAALAGLCVAALCLVTAVITGNPIWDALGSIFVGGILVIVAVLLSVEVKSLIIGEAPEKDYNLLVNKIVSDHIEGSKVLRLIALQVGSHEVMLSYKIHPGEMKDVSTLVSIFNKIEIAVKSEAPEVKWQFVEPDYLI